MKYRINGNITLSDGIELTEPIISCKRVAYDWEEDRAYFDVIFEVENQPFKLLRHYSAECKQSWDKTDAVTAFVNLFNEYELNQIND